MQEAAGTSGRKKTTEDLLCCIGVPVLHSVSAEVVKYFQQGRFKVWLLFSVDHNGNLVDGWI